MHFNINVKENNNRFKRIIFIQIKILIMKLIMLIEYIWYLKESFNKILVEHINVLIVIIYYKCHSLVRNVLHVEKIKSKVYIVIKYY